MKRLAAAPRTGIAASAAIVATFAILTAIAPSLRAQTPNLPPRSGGTSYVGDEAQRKLDQPLAPGVNAVPSPDMPRAPSRVGKNGLGPRAPAAAIGSVSPEVGPWHTFARVSASGLASAAGIRVVWFPGDDDTQAQAGAITATVRGRTPPDQVEIEIPADAGGPQGGVVRILARMPGQLEPVFVARFTVGTGPAAAWSQVQTTTLRFTLSAGERTGAGFAVTSTGPIHVGLQSSGAALVLSLMRPDGHSVERSGSGTLQIDDTVTDADVQSGVLWRVGVRIAHDAPLKRPVRVRRPVSATVVASGSLSVQSPKADSQRAQAALDAEAAKAKRSAADRPAAAQVNVVQIQREEQLVYNQAVAQRQSVALKQLGASVPPEATHQIQQRLSLRAQGQDLQQVQATAPVRLVTGPRRRGGSTASAGSAAGLATTMPDPQLTGSSVGEGDPGTPVSLTGTNFGESAGEVHFIVANGREVAAPVTYWSSAQIVTECPTPTAFRSTTVSSTSSAATACAPGSGRSALFRSTTSQSSGCRP